MAGLLQSAGIKRARGPQTAQIKSALGRHQLTLSHNIIESLPQGGKGRAAWACQGGQAVMS